MIKTSSSSSTRMRQYRRQMKKVKVFSGVTNQLKEVLGRLREGWLGRWCENDEESLGSHTPLPSGSDCFPPPPPAPTHSLGLLQGLRLLTPLPHWLFLGLLHGQQFKLCLHLPLEKGETSSALPWLSPGSTHAGSLSWPHPP